MNCQKCNLQNEETAKFCNNCGAELSIQQSNPIKTIKICQKCNFQNADNVLFCGKCGEKLYYESQINSTPSWPLFTFIVAFFIAHFFHLMHWPLQGILTILMCIPLFLAALVIKNKALKIIGVILVSLIMTMSIAIVALRSYYEFFLW